MAGGGYGAFSYAHSQLDTVYQYILHQVEHHGKKHSKKNTLIFCYFFKGISMAWWGVGADKRVQMTQLKENQLKILTLLDMPDAYQRVWNILETQLALRET